MAKRQETKVSMGAGQKIAREPNVPVILIAGSGRHAYLWVGNDAEGDMLCFATLSGAATLRKLAKAILAEVGE